MGIYIPDHLSYIVKTFHLCRVLLLHSSPKADPHFEILLTIQI
jgi:hypothetical protein